MQSGKNHMIHKILNKHKVVLASESPRRKQLLEMMGLKPLVIPANIAEPITNERPYKQAINHARNKANKVAAAFSPDTIVVGSDTIVVLDQHILGKPADAKQAVDYLKLLSGKDHYVYTAICIMWNNRCISDYERTKVSFCTLSEQEIEEYVKTGEPFDKAGAYGIQGYGAQFIKEVRGCYFNVMGFPLQLFYRSLKEMAADE